MGSGAAAAVVVFLQARGTPPRSAQPVPTPALYTYDVVREYPHDPEAFTQGLLYRDGVLFESTGLNGRSSVRRVELETGKVLQRRAVAAEHFAEGLTDLGSTLIQLTWVSQMGFVYDVASLDPKRTFTYPGEGWGLTHDDRELIMSDGTPSLRFLDPVTFEERRRLTVRDPRGSVDDLNELEFVRGSIYANVWMTDRIAIISPDSGFVTGWLDLSGLRERQGSAGADVLNGIAYDSVSDRLFVTGKLWAKLFEIKLRGHQ